MCAQQDSPTLDASTLYEAEVIMWQAIEGVVTSADGPEKRRSLVRDNSRQVVRDAGFSGVRVLSVNELIFSSNTHVCSEFACGAGDDAVTRRSREHEPWVKP